ncbi:hypothetical protein AALA69_03075 [Eggerthellaceae bacterium 24-137]
MKKIIAVAALTLCALGIFGCTSNEISEYKSNDCVRYFLEGSWAEDAEILAHYEDISDLSDTESGYRYLEASQNLREQSEKLGNLNVDENSDSEVVNLHHELLEGSGQLLTASNGFMNAAIGLSDGEYDDLSAEYMEQILKAQESLNKGIDTLTSVQE